MKLQTPPGPDYRSSAALMDDAGQVLANLHVNLSPALKAGDFRLPANADPGRVQLATRMQTADGKTFRVTNVRLCPGYHSVSVDQPHYEFRYEPA